MPGFANWTQRFAKRYPVTAGEGLKDLDAFPRHFHRLARLAEGFAPRELTVLAVGGGSVGDFAGFFASVYKRGVRLVHMPSTWLAAIDSSHGGKTALNCRGVKNQIGSFYPASQTILVRELLDAQPAERAREAMGELAKIAMIDGGLWTRKLLRSRHQDDQLLWSFLRDAIASKLRVVAKDPLEQNGTRQILNLGHTVGHVLEASQGWAHGAAVAEGLRFAVEFSLQRNLLEPGERHRIEKLLALCPRPRSSQVRLSEARFKALLGQDKKRAGAGRVQFIFLRGLGRVERQPVAIDEIVREAKRQGLVR